MLEWNVFISNFNSGKIETHNIFNHYGIKEDFQKIVKKYIKTLKDDGTFDKKAFADEIRRPLMYYYWSKCEWEIIIDHWPHCDRFREEKVDVYDQISLNWNVFVDYVWDHREELAKWKKKR